MTNACSTGTNVSLVSTFSTRSNEIKRMYRLSRCSMSRPLLLQWLLLPLLLSLLSHTALSASTYFVTRSKSVKDNDINCNKLNSQGKPATYCYEVRVGLQAADSNCMSGTRRVLIVQYCCLPLQTPLTAWLVCDGTPHTICRANCVVVLSLQCGGIAAMAAKCSANARCRAFDM